ncbi:Ig-like domain-containing protein [Actinoplanes sp. CA-252034]|uniref:Ig-like domain-containing protein n=1 Tax=Actinoplanes sp. CA-252034 TaxID=3239906 RepID=UPI003D99F1BD
MPRAVLRSRARQVITAIITMALVVTFGIAVSSKKAEAAITNPFTTRYSVNTNGSILITGNTNMQCSAAVATCAHARAGINDNNGAETLNNNGYVMGYTDTDGSADTFNDSEAAVNMPTGSRVLFAGLYWSADTSAGTSGAAARNAARKRIVRFGVPGGALAGVTATTNFEPSGVTTYQQFADVTAQVAGAGNGSYRVADIEAGTGNDRYAGWALVIAYYNAAEPMHSLRVYDGYGVVSSNSASVDITVSGIQTPQTGSFATAIGTVVYEGDYGKVGDALKLNGVSVSDPENPVTNFFNSSVSTGGTANTARNPNARNLMGIDADQFDATGLLANNDTSAALRLTTVGDTFYPGAITFTTTLFAPDLDTVTTVDDLNDGDLLPGDTVEYDIAVRNEGIDGARNAVLTDAVPSGMTFVPGSMTVAGAPVADTAAPLTFTLPNLAMGATTHVTFRARVNESTAPGTPIVNVPTMRYEGAGTGLVLNGIGDTSTVTVQRPLVDLVAHLTVTPSVVNRDATPATVTVTASARNDGTGLEPLPVATVDLPAGVTPGSLPHGCSAASRRVTCALPSVAPTTTTSIAFPATVDRTTADRATAKLTVTGVGDDDTPADNADAVDLTLNTSPRATGETASTGSGTAVIIRVRDNDSDADDTRGTLTVAISTPPAHGSVVVNDDQTITYTPDPGWRGTDTFVYQVSDGNGAFDTATVDVGTANADPVAVTDDSSTGPGDPVTIDVLANDADVNGDTRTLDAVTQPRAGTGSARISDGKIVYTPAPTFKGTVSFTYTISDGYGGTTTGTVTVTVANGPPVAADDSGSVAYRGTATLDVLANDTDPNDDPLAVSAVSTPDHGAAQVQDGKIVYTAPEGFSGTAAFTYTIRDDSGQTATADVRVEVANAAPVPATETASTDHATPVIIDPAGHSTDPNGDTLTVSGTTTPAHGTVVLDDDGTLTYTPDTGFRGVETFGYTVSDGRASATGTVTVTVANAVPVARPDTLTVSSNAPTTLDVLANDTDPNGDTLTVTVDVAPSAGQAEVLGGTITYRAPNGFHGADSFGYTVSDGHGGTAHAVVSVVAVDMPPRAHPDAAGTGTNGTVTISVLANDDDPNGDELTMTATTAPGHGTLETTPGGVVTYTPATGFCGTDVFTYTVADPAGNTGSATVVVTVANVAPNALDDRFTVRSGVATTLNVLANDTDANTGQVLSVLRAQTPAHGAATITDGRLVYKPDAGFAGAETFTYELTDELGATDAAVVTVTVSGLPVAASDSAATPSGKAVDINVTGNDSDPDGGRLTVVRTAQPAHGRVAVNADRTVRYSPASAFHGIDTFTYTIEDAAGDTADGKVTVVVGNAAPVAAADVAAVQSGRYVDVDVLGNDSDPNGDQRLGVASVGEPGHGTAAVTGDRIRYTPRKDFAGTDEFTYEVSDGEGGKASAAVTVTVTDHLPIAVADRGTTPYQRALAIPVLDNDVAPEGPLALVSIGTPDHGTATADGDQIVYTPADGFSGVATFEYRARDTLGQSTGSTVTVTVSPAPHAPDKEAVTKPDEPVVIPLPTVDKNGIGITVTEVGEPAHGTVQLNPDGTFTYTPDKGFTGTDSFTYEAMDADGNLTTGTITVTVAGDGAGISPSALKDRYTVEAGGTVTFMPTANDSDPNGGDLTLVKISKPDRGTATMTDLTVTYVAPTGFTGTETLGYTIRNGNGSTAKATIAIRVTAAATVELPTTGADLVPAASAGVAAIVIGGVLVLLTAGQPGRHRPGRHRS